MVVAVINEFLKIMPTSHKKIIRNVIFCSTKQLNRDFGVICFSFRFYPVSHHCLKCNSLIHGLCNHVMRGHFDYDEASYCQLSEKLQKFVREFVNDKMNSVAEVKCLLFFLFNISYTYAF